MEDLIIKQEFTKEYERIRAPIQEWYWSQFKESMQLKLEVINLRKKVLHLRRWVWKHKNNFGRPTMNLGAKTTLAVV